MDTRGGCPGQILVLDAVQCVLLWAMRVSWCTVGVCRCGLRQRNSRSSFRTAIIHVHAAAGCMGSTRSSGEFSLGPGRRLLPVTIQMASGASSWFRGSRWRAWLILQLRMQSDADRCYIAVIQLARRVSPAAGCRASFCWRNPPCRWTQPCQVVEFNYQFMSKVCYIFNMNWEWSSSTATDAGWDIRLDGSGESVSPNRVHPRFSCFQCWPQLEPSLEARESVDVLCCTTPGLVWDFNYVALLLELDYQMILKAQIFKIIW